LEIVRDRAVVDGTEALYEVDDGDEKDIVDEVGVVTERAAVDGTELVDESEVVDAVSGEPDAD
jgi:hypothetical protein